LSIDESSDSNSSVMEDRLKTCSLVMAVP
jgi:hypothetical protein